MIEPPNSVIGSVRLSRGTCYGTCPVYEVVLRRDGRASWRGEAFTERLGKFDGQVDEADFLRLASFIQRVFFEWQDEYVAPVTDNPTYELEVVRDGDRKRVVQYATDEPTRLLGDRGARRLDRVEHRMGGATGLTRVGADRYPDPSRTGDRRTPSRTPESGS